MAPAGAAPPQHETAQQAGVSLEAIQVTHQHPAVIWD